MFWLILLSSFKLRYKPFIFWLTNFMFLKNYLIIVKYAIIQMEMIHRIQKYSTFWPNYMQMKISDSFCQTVVVQCQCYTTPRVIAWVRVNFAILSVSCLYLLFMRPFIIFVNSFRFLLYPILHWTVAPFPGPRTILMEALIYEVWKISIWKQINNLI